MTTADTSDMRRLIAAADADDPTSLHALAAALVRHGYGRRDRPEVLVVWSADINGHLEPLPDEYDSERQGYRLLAVPEELPVDALIAALRHDDYHVEGEVLPLLEHNARPDTITLDRLIRPEDFRFRDGRGSGSQWETWSFARHTLCRLWGDDTPLDVWDAAIAETNRLARLFNNTVGQRAAEMGMRRGTERLDVTLNDGRVLTFEGVMVEGAPHDGPTFSVLATDAQTHQLELLRDALDRANINITSGREP